MIGLMFGREVRRHRTGFVIWSAVLLLGSIFRMSEFPQFVDTFGTDAAALGGFSATEIETFGLAGLPLTEVTGYFGGRVFSLLVLLASIHLMMLAVTILGGEEGEGTIEFLLVKPVTRGAVVTAKMLTVLFYALMMTIVVYGGSWIVFAAVSDAEVPAAEVLLFAAGSFLITVGFAAVGLLLSTFIRNARTAYPVGIGIVLAAYFLYIVTGSSPNADWLQYASFFAYIEAADVVVDTAVPPVQLVALLAIIALAFVTSYQVYDRKDITT